LYRGGVDIWFCHQSIRLGTLEKEVNSQEIEKGGRRMNIKILGSGCARCHQLEKTTREAVKELGIDATIEEVKDINKIVEYAVLTTPGLVINEELVCAGRLPTKPEITQLITTALTKEDRTKR
jgi:small redox-active disulfide protein 2